MASGKKILYNDSSMSRKLAITLVGILLALNIGAGYFLFYSARAKADNLTNSAKTASENVTIQNAAKFGLNIGDLPKTDVVGEDLTGIKRYPKAVRTAYTKATDGTVTFEYKVLMPVNVVLGFYKTQFALDGWILDSESPEIITFDKDIQKISVSGVSSGGVTTYTMVLK